jgi:signal transduction histidine kinase
MNNIFASAEIEAGEAMCEFYQIDLPGMVKKTIRKYKELASENQQNITFEKPAHPSAHDLRSDPAKIQLIIDNLIVNAISWSKNKGKITISTSVNAEMATIAVSDPGPGIDKKNQEQIFNRFKTLDTSVHTLNKGHGLGLSIVKSYVEMLDGSITITGNAQGGNVFTVKIKNQPSGEKTEGTSESGNDFLFDEQTELF